MREKWFMGLGRTRDWNENKIIKGTQPLLFTTRGGATAGQSAARLGKVGELLDVITSAKFEIKRSMIVTLVRGYKLPL